MSQSLPYHEIRLDKNVSLKYTLKTPDDSNIGFFIEIESNIPDVVKGKTKNSVVVLKTKLDFKINLLEK